MKLYEIADEYKTAIAELSEMEDVSPQAIADTLEAFKGELVDKGRAVVAFSLNMESDIDQLKEFEAKIKAKRVALENRSKGMRDYLKHNMVACGITEIKANDGTWKAKITKPTKVVAISGDVPTEYSRVTVAPDKTAIKKALQAGAELSFARLEDSQPGLRIS